MSRYTLLLLLNTPFVVGGILNAVVSYKLKRQSKRKFIFQIFLWLAVFVGLASSEALYNFLFSHQLTQTEPLSLFDVVQITGILLLFFMVNRNRSKIEAQEKRIQDLHQELSIKLRNYKD